MDQMFGRLSFCVVYVDDILVFSDNHTDQMEHLRQVLQNNSKRSRIPGNLNYYHRFVPHAASICAPLYETIANKPKCLLWAVDQDIAFHFSRYAGIYPLPNAPIYVPCIRN
ncbi:Uncharacterised protein g937 [Pycnogonum litorale]